MTHASDPGRARRLLVALLALCLTAAPAARAQQDGVTDLWSIPPAEPAPGIEGQAPQLADPVGERVLEIGMRLDRFRSEGYVMPDETDISAYSDDTLRALEMRLDAQDDPCIAALDAALFLDAHVDETRMLQWLASIDNKGELVARMARRFYEAEGLGDGLQGVALQKVPYMTLVDGLLKVQETLPVINEYVIGSVAQREGAWSHDIFERSQRGGWDEAKIGEVQQNLLDLRKKSANRLSEHRKTLDDANAAAHRAHGERMMEADKVRAAEMDKLRTLEIQLRGGLSPEVKRSRLADIRNAYDAALVASTSARTRELQIQLDRFETATRAEQLKIAQYEVQFSALSDFVLPVVRRECERITKSGLRDVKEKRGVSSGGFLDPEDRVLSAIIALPHDKLMPTLRALGVTASEDFLNCLCRSAGYGGSQTRQFYHPDTLGEYDERYSCQHPGDPCIVAGMGCTRHPLPSDMQTWKACAGRTAEQGAPSLTETIKAEMARRSGQE